MATLEQARAAKTKAMGLQSSGWQTPVLGIGISRQGDDPDNNYVVKINLTRPATELPTEIDGVPIVTEVVGDLAKRQ